MEPKSFHGFFSEKYAGPDITHKRSKNGDKRKKNIDQCPPKKSFLLLLYAKYYLGAARKKPPPLTVLFMVHPAFPESPTNRRAYPGRAALPGKEQPGARRGIPSQPVWPPLGP